MENTQNIRDLVQKFYPYAKDALGFDHPVRVIMRKDAENAEKPLGKTAYYDPEQKLIVLYVTNRHPKDVLRSFSHELVHHAQNCRGDLADLAASGHYAKDGKGREIEKEAYLQGNLNLRDYEDKLKFEGANQMNEHVQIAKEEFKKLVAETFRQVMAEKKAKPDFLDLDKDGDKEESMKQAAKDKKEKEVKEADDKPKYAKSQDKEHDDNKNRNAKLASIREESKELNTETQQKLQEAKETNKAWYNSSLYNKLKSKWTK